MKPILLDIYKGRDNAPSRQFSAGDPATPIPFLDLGVSAIGVVLDGVEYSSTQGYIDYDNFGTITFNLGLITEYPEGVKVSRIVLYDGGHPRGKIFLSELTDTKIAFRFA